MTDDALEFDLEEMRGMILRANLSMGDDIAHEGENIRRRLG